MPMAWMASALRSCPSASTPARTDNPPASANSLRDTCSLSHANATRMMVPANASVPIQGWNRNITSRNSGNHGASKNANTALPVRN